MDLRVNHFSSEKHANATHAHSPRVRALPTHKPCRNGQRLQRWDDDHDGTITINTTDEEDSIRQSCFCVFQYMSYCLSCVPYAWLCTQQQHFFLNRTWSESNSHTAYECPNQKLLREIRSVIRGLPPTSCWCGYFLLAFIGNSALLGAYSIEGYTNPGCSQVYSFVGDSGADCCGGCSEPQCTALHWFFDGMSRGQVGETQYMHFYSGLEFSPFPTRRKPMPCRGCAW